MEFGGTKNLLAVLICGADYCDHGFIAVISNNHDVWIPYYQIHPPI
jgi:hypothetical protein